MRNSSAARKLESHAEVFAALGDATRLKLVSRLLDGRSQSIATLTEGTQITRQAVTKHLAVLERVGLVSSLKDGRTSLYELDPRPLASMADYLKVIAQQWDRSLQDLKAFVEK